MTSWLPPGKTAAICFTIDDVHPGTSRDPYEAGGDLGNGALGLVAKLLAKHPPLHVTLFVTADWREIYPMPTRRWLARVPYVRDRVYLTDVHPVGKMRLDRHRAFVEYLNGLPRTEIGLHGLHHIHHGPKVLVEFQEQSKTECERILREALDIFTRAGVRFVRGMTPPGWNAPAGLLDAMAALGFAFVASARDIRTPVARGARAEMSGLRGVALYEPDLVAGGLVHLPSNFQATSPKERALEIIEAGGLLSIKGHIIKKCGDYVALDGIDELYCNYLDSLFTLLEQRYGDRLWWTTMGRLRNASARPRATPQRRSLLDSSVHRPRRRRLQPVLLHLVDQRPPRQPQPPCRPRLILPFGFERRDDRRALHFCQMAAHVGAHGGGTHALCGVAQLVGQVALVDHVAAQDEGALDRRS